MLGTDLAGLDRLALAASSGAGGLTLLPYLDGERTPDLPDATGTLTGLTRANATPENLARAAVEGMLLNLVAGVDALREKGIRVERVLLIGGGVGLGRGPRARRRPVRRAGQSSRPRGSTSRSAPPARRRGRSPASCRRWEAGVDARSDPTGDPGAAEARDRYLALRAADLA